MKKKIGILFTAVLAAAALTGCLDNKDDGLADKLRPVQPGIDIYNATTFQNEMALQPADAALKLAVLRAEAAAQQKPDDLDYVIVEGVGNLKTLLFGWNTKITKEEDGYLIQFAGAGGAPGYDIYARTGAVRVRMQGVELEQTSADVPWTVEVVAAEPLTVRGGMRDVTLTSSGEMALYRQDAAYRIAFSGAAAYIEKKHPADWSGNFVWTPEKPGEFSFSALKETSSGFAGSAQGRSFWLMNGKSAARMSYRLTDGKFTPSLAGYRRLVGGTEVCRLTDPADYSQELYPSPEVTVVWTLNDKRLNYSVTYNGTTADF